MEIQKHEDASPLTLFYSYANQDEKWCEELEKHLSILQRHQIIAGWHRQKILPGTKRRDSYNVKLFVEICMYFIA